MGLRITSMQSYLPRFGMLVAFLKFSLKKCLEYWECLQSHAVYFDQHNLFLHCRQERKRDQKKRIFVLSQLLSNVKQKGEINSHPSHEKQQQDELNWEDGHCSS